ncbi:MAG TPA: redoxin domain-containing protein [Longimicrobium sp.]|nr:redoxin domain-containing protein [Longimicrobium sp.]
MRTPAIWMVAVAGAAAAVTGVVAARSPAAPEPPAAIALREGDPLPALELADGVGRTVRLRDVVAGHAAAVTVMHPACEHCHRQIANLAAALAAGGGERPVQVLISIGDSAAMLAGLPTPATFMLLRDRAHVLASRYALRGVPVTLLVDRRGVVRYVHLGVMDDDALRTALRRIVPQRA